MKPPIALVWPGHGAQRVGMGSELDRCYSVAHEAFIAAEDATGLPIRRLCFEGPASELDRIENLQPCLTAVSWAAFEVLTSQYGMESITVVAGHSLGELAALAAAGALTWETALRLAHAEGMLLSQAFVTNPGGMLAIVGLDEEQVDGIVKAASADCPLWIGSRNAPDQFVLVGSSAALARGQQLATDAGARRTTYLNVPGPTHSPLVAAALEPIRELIADASVATPSQTVLSNDNGEPITTEAEVRSELTMHLLRPVNWSRCMVRMAACGVRTVVELGPGRALASLAFKNMPDVDCWNADELLSGAQSITARF